MEKPSLIKEKAKRKRAVKQYTVLRCPMVGHQASWCRHLCKPTNGKGVCGRPATHYMKDRYQIAIARSRKRRQQSAEGQSE